MRGWLAPLAFVALALSVPSAQACQRDIGAPPGSIAVWSVDHEQVARFDVWDRFMDSHCKARYPFDLTPTHLAWAEGEVVRVASLDGGPIANHTMPLRPSWVALDGAFVLAAEEKAYELEGGLAVWHPDLPFAVDVALPEGWHVRGLEGRHALLFEEGSRTIRLWDALEQGWASVPVALPEGHYWTSLFDGARIFLMRPSQDTLVARWGEDTWSPTPLQGILWLDGETAWTMEPTGHASPLTHQALNGTLLATYSNIRYLHWGGDGGRLVMQALNGEDPTDPWQWASVPATPVPEGAATPAPAGPAPLALAMALAFARRCT